MFLFYFYKVFFSFAAGGVVNISGVYKVRPRIIFISDGCPTDEAQATGSDIQSNVNQVCFLYLSVNCNTTLPSSHELNHEHCN
jgi:uncharacterized protein YegL